VTTTDTTTDPRATPNPPDPSEAEIQARLLYELAQHMNRHKELCMVHVDPDQRTGYPVQVGPGAALRLYQWALSLSHPNQPEPVIKTATVPPNPLDLLVYVTGALDSGNPFCVWADVKGASYLVGLPDLADPHKTVRLTLSDLEALAVGQSTSGQLDVETTLTDLAPVVTDEPTEADEVSGAA